MFAFNFQNFFLSAIIRDPDKIHQLLDGILGEKEFRAAKSSVIEQKWESFIRYLNDLPITKKINELLIRVLDALIRLLANPVSAGLVKIVLFALLGLMLAFLIFAIKKKITLSLSAGEAESLDFKTMKPVDREKIAEDFAARGDFVEAMRHFYISLLLFLSEREILEFIPSRTNRETERLVSSQAADSFRSSFHRLNEIFEHKVYALKMCSRDEFDEFRETYCQCKKEAGSR